MMMHNLAAYFSSLSHTERKELVENHAKEIATWIIKNNGYVLVGVKDNFNFNSPELESAIDMCLEHKYGIARSSKDFGKYRLYYSMKLPAKKVEKIEKHVIDFEIPEFKKHEEDSAKLKEMHENFIKGILGDELWDAIFGNN